MVNPIDWKKICEGDKSVFNRMFDCYYQSLCGFVFPYIKNQQVVEDIVIDCFAKIWEERESLEIRSSLQNYLVTIVKNSALDYLRKNKYQESDINRISYSVPDDFSDPMDDTGLMNKLYATINKIPEQRRKILKMAAFEEKTYAEIAEELQISVNTVKTQMARAYKFLRTELDVNQRTIHFLLFV